MVIVTQKISVVTKLDFVVIFFPFWGVLYLPITFEPVELQKTTAPIFWVAASALLNGYLKYIKISTKSLAQPNARHSNPKACYFKSDPLLLDTLNV